MLKTPRKPLRGVEIANCSMQNCLQNCLNRPAITVVKILARLRFSVKTKNHFTIYLELLL